MKITAKYALTVTTTKVEGISADTIIAEVERFIESSKPLSGLGVTGITLQPLVAQLEVSD